MLLWTIPYHKCSCSLALAPLLLLIFLYQ